MSQYKIIGRASDEKPQNGYKIVGRANESDEAEEDDTTSSEPEYKEESALGKLPRNIGIGLLNLGHSSFNYPHDLAKIIEKRGEEFGEAIKGSMPKLPEGLMEALKNRKQSISADTVPHLPEYNFAELLGQKGQGTMLDKIIQKSIEHIPEIIGGRSLLKAGLKKVPLTQKMAGKPLNEAKELIRNSEVPPVPYGDEMADITTRAAPFLDKTRNTQRMIHEAEQGNYDALFSLQSQLGKESRALKKSSNASDRRVHMEPQELKHDILDHMEAHLRKHGANEAADLLRSGIKDYKTYIKIREKIYPTLKKFGIPIGLVSSLVYGKNKITDMLK